MTNAIPIPESHQDETWEIGTDNVFADLNMPDAAEKLAKAELALRINQILKRKKLIQIEAAKISLLNRGRLSYFSIERLVRYLNLLNQDVEIVVRKSKTRGDSAYGKLSVVYA